MNRNANLVSGLLALVTITALTLAWAPPAPAFRTICSGGYYHRMLPHTHPGSHVDPDLISSNPFSRWDLREFDECRVVWSRHDGTNDIAGAAEFAEVAAAFTVWSDVAPAVIDFVEVAAPPGAMAPHIIDGNNMIGWGDSLGAATLAATIFTADRFFGTIEEADILFNDPDYDWQILPDTTLMGGDPDVRSIAIHEIGHFLGLHHPTLDGDANPDGPIMEPYFDLDSASVHHVFEDDEDGANFLYSNDLGDAPDPLAGTFNRYQTLVHEPDSGRGLNGVTLDRPGAGAVHGLGIKRRQPDRNYTYEWLGGAPAWSGPMGSAGGGTDDVDAECTPNIPPAGAPAGDIYDDGVTFAPLPPAWLSPLTITGYVRYANDAAGETHSTGSPLDSLNFNVWEDIAVDGKFDEPFDHVIAARVGRDSLSGANADTLVTVSRTIIALALREGPVYFRARLDYAEHAGALGAFFGDPVFTGPEGYLHFGEVEDYHFWCDSPYVNYNIHLKGTSKIGLRLVSRGNPTVVGNFAAVVDENDCLIGEIAPGTFDISYDSFTNERTVFCPTNTDSCSWRHIGICTPPPGPSPRARGEDPGYPQTVRRLAWVPPSGNPQTEDWIPTTHTGYMDFGDEKLMLVGILNEQAGGLIVPDGSGGWNDSAFVEVSYWVSPEWLPIERLTPCDSLVASLTPVAVGSGWIWPDRPFAFQAPHMQPDDTLILEVKSSWSINGNENNEYIEHRAPLDAATGIESLAPIDWENEAESLRSYPNPVRDASRVRFVVRQGTEVTLEVFDVAGRRVRTLLDSRPLAQGEHVVDWELRDRDGRKLATGLYFLRLRVGDRVESHKFVVLK